MFNFIKITKQILSEMRFPYTETQIVEIITKFQLNLLANVSNIENNLTVGIECKCMPSNGNVLSSFLFQKFTSLIILLIRISKYNKK